MNILLIIVIYNLFEMELQTNTTYNQFIMVMDLLALLQNYDKYF